MCLHRNLHINMQNSIQDYSKEENMKELYRNKKKKIRGEASTLCTNEDHGDLSCVPVAGQAQEIIVHRLEADLILQTEDKNHGIDPSGELKMEQIQAASLSNKKLWNSYFRTQISINVLVVQCRVSVCRVWRGILCASVTAETFFSLAT